MAALSGIDRDLLDKSTGHQRHPKLRQSILDAARQDVEFYGWEYAFKTWAPFCGISLDELRERKKAALDAQNARELARQINDRPIAKYGLKMSLFTGAACGGQQMKIWDTFYSQNNSPGQNLGG